MTCGKEERQYVDKIEYLVITFAARFPKLSWLFQVSVLRATCVQQSVPQLAPDGILEDHLQSTVFGLQGITFVPYEFVLRVDRCVTRIFLVYCLVCICHRHDARRIVDTVNLISLGPLEAYP